MPKHATPINGDLPEDDDYSYAWTVKPVTTPAEATPTLTAPADQRLADLEVAVKIILYEMQHLRDDIKRITTGESPI